MNSNRNINNKKNSNRNMTNKSSIIVQRYLPDKKAQNYREDTNLVTCFNGTSMRRDGEGEEQRGAQCIMGNPQSRPNEGQVKSILCVCV